MSHSRSSSEGTPQTRSREPIDLKALKAAAMSDNGPSAVVERAWLKRVYEELSEARAAQGALGRVFGRSTL